MNAWYSTLNRPPLTPPNWIFGPVWTVLYAMIGVAIVLYYRKTPRPWNRRTTGILLLHLLANFAWTPIFFSLRSPAWALADILLLDLTLLYLIAQFSRASGWAAALLAPYLLWILFATYLNTGFLVLN